MSGSQGASMQARNAKSQLARKARSTLPEAFWRNIVAYIECSGEAPSGVEQVFWVSAKLWLANLQLICCLLGQLLADMVLQIFALQKPIVDVAIWAPAALLHHELGIHELQEKLM